MSVTSSFDTALGALFLATVASAFLFGMTCLQVYFYYQWYPKDSWLNKIFVAVLWVLDSLCLAFTVHLAYRYFVTESGQLAAFTKFEWDIRAQALIIGIIPPIVQSMYARRVWKLSEKNKVIPMILFVALIGCWVMFVVSFREAFVMNNVLKEASVNKALFVGFPISGATDIYISLSMAYLLYRSQQTFSATESLIENIILWVIGTGVLTSIGALIVLITYTIMPDNLVYYAADIIVSKLYINGFLVLLNIRRNLRSNSAANVFVIPSARGRVSVGPSVSPKLDISQQKQLAADTADDSFDCRDTAHAV